MVQLLTHTPDTAIVFQVTGFEDRGYFCPVTFVMFKYLQKQKLDRASANRMTSFIIKEILLLTTHNPPQKYIYQQKQLSSTYNMKTN